MLKCNEWDKFIGNHNGVGKCYVCNKKIDSKYLVNESHIQNCCVMIAHYFIYL
jgi:hypothetical protein